MVNPVNGAVGLLSTGNWHVCQSAVETVLRSGVPRSLPEFSGLNQSPEFDEVSEANNDDLYGSRDLNTRLLKRKGFKSDETRGLDLGLTTGFPARLTARRRANRENEKLWPGLPSDESEMMTLENGSVCDRDSQRNNNGHESKLLRLFV